MTLAMTSICICRRYLSSLTCRITRTHRLNYLRKYPTLVVNPDGSTFSINYFEPRRIIRLPLNIWTLNESERRVRLEQRKPRTQVKIVEDIDDQFNSNTYLDLIHKK